MVVYIDMVFQKKYDIHATKRRIVEWILENIPVGSRVHYSIVAGHTNLPLDFVRNWARYIASLDEGIVYDHGQFTRMGRIEEFMEAPKQ